MAGKFSLADLIAEGKVSKMDTAREQIEYIDIGLIQPDPNNFYELSGLDELAANIELMGLQQPIRVRTHPDNPAAVIVVSGHRRRAAIQKLVDEGRGDLAMIPCIREQVEGSAAMQELRLIYANSDTRRMTSAEVSRQVERVEALLYQLKEEGYEFPGRMRDHVAEACKVSQSKLARLKVIREGLDKCWVKYYEKGELPESTAYTLARMSPDFQKTIREWAREADRTIKYLPEREISVFGERLKKVSKLKCDKDGAACGNLHGKMKKALTINTWQPVHCDKCCSGCPDLAKCKYACPHLADKVKQLKAEASAQRKQDKLEQEERDRPVIEKIKALWNRFGMARNAADKTVEECCKATGKYFMPSEEQKFWKMECLEANYTPNTTLPYGYSCYLSEVEKYTKLADLLGCSLDYLLCRTDDPKGFAAPAVSVEPPLAAPAGVVWYPQSMDPPDGANVVTIDRDGDADFGRYAAGTLQDSVFTSWDSVACWTMAPDRDSLVAPPAVEPPAEGCAPLRWIPGTEMPKQDGQKAVGRFAVPGMDKPLEGIVKWDEFDRVWKFHNGSGSIECKCLAWFPLPEE